MKKLNAKAPGADEAQSSAKAKRRVKQNVWGNWSGYVGTKKAQEFGTNEVSAGYWLITGEVDFYAGYADEWIDRCKSAAHGIEKK